MKIQSISIAQKTGMSFGQREERRFNDMSVLKQQSINASLYDLYQMEDRINSKIEKQNKMLGQTLYNISEFLYYPGSDGEYLNAKRSAEILKNNGIVA